MNCKSCNKPIENEFCPYCGQKVIEQRLTVKSIFKLAVSKLFDLENSFWTTIKLLFKQPEEVVNGYLSGATKLYYNPVRFIVIAVALSLLTMSFSGFDPNEMMGGINSNNLNQISDEAMAYQNSLINILSSFMQLVSLIIVPFFALATWLLFKKQQLNYAEHLAINCYGLGVATLIGIPSAIFGSIFMDYFILSTGIGIFLSIVYYAYFFKRLWKANFFVASIKSVFTVIFGYIFYMIALASVAIIVGVFFKIMQ